VRIVLDNLSGQQKIRAMLTSCCHLRNFVTAQVRHGKKGVDAGIVA
jgi:hypothetical protein